MNGTKLNLPCLMLGLGAAALGLRFCLYTFGVDEKGLLVPFHLLHILLWVAAAAAVAVTVIGLRRQKETRQGIDTTLSRRIAGADSLLLALAILAVVGTGAYSTMGLGRICGGLGIVAAAALVWLAACHIRNLRPSFAAYGLVCVFFALHMVGSYQTWSGNPQLQDSVFSMAGMAMLALFAYQNAALAVDLGRLTLRNALGLLAGFACLTAAAHTEFTLLYLAGGLWALASIPVSPAASQDMADQGPSEE